MRIRIQWVLCLALLGSSGCASLDVKPWQRGDLARPEMAWDAGLMQQSIRQHVFVSKEASSGGGSLAGGGCGCN